MVSIKFKNAFDALDLTAVEREDLEKRSKLIITIRTKIKDNSLPIEKLTAFLNIDPEKVNLLLKGEIENISLTELVEISQKLS